MPKRFRDNLFFIGAFLFCAATALEMLFPGEGDLTCFVRGLACGLGGTGVVRILLSKQRVLIEGDQKHE